MMKKLTALILALGMVLSLCACGGEAGTPDSQDGETDSGLVDVPTSGQNVVQTAVPLIAGEQLGTWEKLGLNVTAPTMSPVPRSWRQTPPATGTLAGSEPPPPSQAF